MNFETAVNLVLMHEGDMSDNPHDPGGLTKFGISKKAFPNVDIANITLAQAKEIYRHYYWDMCSCEKLPPWARLLVFDCAVNQGATRAIIFIQRSTSTPNDGIIGPITLAAIKAMSPEEFISTYAKYRHAAYKSNPNWRHFGAGWSARLLDMTCLSFASVIRGYQAETLLT